MKCNAHISNGLPVGYLGRWPFWLGAVIVSFVPTRILSTIDYLIAPSQGLGGLILDESLFLSLIMLYFLYGMRYITRRIDRLAEYARGMSSGNTALPLGTHYRLSRVLLVWIILLEALNALSPIPLTVEGFAKDQIPVFAYFFLILAFFLWTYGSSMLAIYRAGRLPFRLKPFTEDRTLGLRPFGTVSLRLASVYSIFPIIVTILQLLTINVEVPGGVTVGLGSFRASDAVFLGGLIFVGVVLFLLPLVGIHRRLQEARSQELNWITPRYTTLVQRLKDRAIRSDGLESVNEKDGLASELSMVRQIESDIHRIQTWPFDIGVITRLATVLVLPPILGVLARVMILIFLRI
jgi:hypothetical protein